MLQEALTRVINTSAVHSLHDLRAKPNIYNTHADHDVYSVYSGLDQISINQIYEFNEVALVKQIR